MPPLKLSCCQCAPAGLASPSLPPAPLPPRLTPHTLRCVWFQGSDITPILPYSYPYLQPTPHPALHALPQGGDLTPNGFVFSGIDGSSLDSALNRAFSMYKGRPEAWKELVVHTMEQVCANVCVVACGGVMVGGCKGGYGCSCHLEDRGQPTPARLQYCFDPPTHPFLISYSSCCRACAGAGRVLLSSTSSCTAGRGKAMPR